MQPSKSLLAAFCFVVTSAIIGCGPIDHRQGDGPSYYPVQFGVIEGIDYVQREGGTSGAGALIGAIAGGVIGHQIGSGGGNTVATIAGAIGGGLVGNEVERRRRREDEDFRIGIRMEDGSYRTVITRDDPNLRVGDKIVIDNGRVYRR
jgi:outer membrane lipoprotein SlyB